MPTWLIFKLTVTAVFAVAGIGLKYVDRFGAPSAPVELHKPVPMSSRRMGILQELLCLPEGRIKPGVKATLWIVWFTIWLVMMVAVPNE